MKFIIEVKNCKSHPKAQILKAVRDAFKYASIPKVINGDDIEKYLKVSVKEQM